LGAGRGVRGTLRVKDKIEVIEMPPKEPPESGTTNAFSYENWKA
jgi:hypothetical protein